MAHKMNLRVEGAPKARQIDSYLNLTGTVVICTCPRCGKECRKPLDASIHFPGFKRAFPVRIPCSCGSEAETRVALVIQVVPASSLSGKELFDDDPPGPCPERLSWRA
jgi:hypothetical protein